MFCCAQLDSVGVVRTIAMLAGPVEAPHIVPLPEYRPDLLGRKYDRDTGLFYGLEAIPSATTVPAGQSVTITVSWRDLDGQLVDDTEPVTATCDGQTVQVAMSGGQGEFEFVPQAPGRYLITVTSASGVTATTEVVAE